MRPAIHFLLDAISGFHVLVEEKASVIITWHGSQRTNTIEGDPIIDLIDESVLDPSRWPVALAALSKAIGGAGAHLVVVDKAGDGQLGGTPRFKTMGTNAMDPDMGAQYMKHWRTEDPLLPAALGSSGPPGTILLCHDFLNEEFVAKSSYFQEYLIPGGGRFQAGVTLENDHRRVVMLDLHLRVEPMSRERLARWNYVFDHLRRSIRLSVRLAEQLQHSNLLRSVIDSRGIACVMVDQDLNVIDHSTAGGNLLAQGDLLRLDFAGKLSIADLSKMPNLKALIEAACFGNGGNILQVAGATPDPIVLQVVPVGVTSQNPFVVRSSNCALVFVEQRVVSRCPSVDLIRLAFKCSAAES